MKSLAIRRGLLVLLAIILCIVISGEFFLISDILDGRDQDLINSPYFHISCKGSMLFMHLVLLVLEMTLLIVMALLWPSKEQQVIYL